MKARAWLKISVGLLAALFAALPIAQDAPINVVYINGIQNTLADAEDTRWKINLILRNSDNRSGSNKKRFSTEAVWNPIGWYGKDPENFVEVYIALRQDLKELFLLKAAEERYADSMARILLPHNEQRTIHIESAEEVREHLLNMMPGGTSLEAGIFPSMTEESMAGTQTAALALARKVRSLGSAVVIAHSQGNLLANLAWATLAAEYGNGVGSVMKLVNIANTSKFSINGLNFTHGGDAALFSAATNALAPTGDQSLETLPSREGWTRSSVFVPPACSANEQCHFSLARPTFLPYLGEIAAHQLTPADFYLHHSIAVTYLSDQSDIVVLPVPAAEPLGVPFTPSRARMVDRFEDFVYAAAASLGPASPNVAPTIAPGGQPRSITAATGSTVTFTVVATGSAPLTYQWRRNGTPVPCTSSVDCSNLSWTVGAADDGARFSVIVSNPVGPSVTSDSALLNVSVTPPPTGSCVTQTVTWTQGASVCNATYAGGQSGTSVLLSDLSAPTTGTATASCIAGQLSLTSPTCATAPPPGLIAPTSLAPSGTITSLTPVFSWSGGSGAANYEINVRDVTTGTIVFTQQGISTANTSFAMPAGILVNARQYRWDITACPNFACSSGFVTSGNLTFVTQAPPPTVPDLIAQGVVFEPGTVTVGGMTLVTFSVTNTGAATSSASQAAVRITPAAATDPGIANVGSVSIPGIATGGSVVRTVGVNVPTAEGAYKVWVVADSNDAAGQSTATRVNDASAAPLALTVVPRVIPLGGTAEGVYGGTMTGGPNPNFRMLVLEDGEFWSLYGVNVGGQLSVGGFIQGRAASGGGSLSASDVKDFGFFPAVGGGTIVGTFDATAGTLQASVRFPGLTVNVVGGPVRDVPYEYNQPASLTALVGTWALLGNTGDRIALTIAATGAMTATSAAGCSFTGTVAPRPSGKNVFNASLQFGASPCLLPGQSMSGVAVVHRLQDGRTQLTFAGVNAARTAGLMAAGTR